jgi:hypothetical protein
MVRVRMPSLISSSDSSPDSRYLFISSSLASAAASTMFSRHFLGGQQVGRDVLVLELHALEASSQMMAFILMRSTTPVKFSSAPMGITMGTGLAFRRVFIWS